jgi:peptide/nickel transport system permease protein
MPDRMGRLLLRRLLQGIPLVLGVIVLNFALIQAAPGTLLDVMTSDQQITDPATVQHLRVLYGMDQPPWMQLLKYIASIAQLDFGFSYRQNMPVLQVILSQLPATLLLMLSALGIALLVGVTAGAVAASRVNTIWDNLLSLLAVFFFAAPSFWLGIMLVILFSVKLGWLPVGGMASLGASEHGVWFTVIDVLHHLILPAITLGLFYAAVYARVMRASMLEVFGLDFVRTARAKGLSNARVVMRHVMRNAMLPIVTLFGLQLGTVLGGSVVVETVFSWPGIGSLLLDSVASRNYPVVLGVLVLGSVVVILANIMVDLAYLRLDPRIAGR